MSARAWTLFAAVSAVWGVPYLFIKIALDGGMPPLTLAWGRVLLAAVVLLALAARSGTLAAARTRWRHVLAYGVFEIAIPLPLIAIGERHVSSSLAAIIVASVPLIVALLALRFDHAERATGSRLFGLVVGLAGVVLLVGLDASGSLASLLSAGAILVAAIGYSLGPLILKWGLSDVDPRATMGASLAVAAVLLAPGALLDAPARLPSGGALASTAVLGLVCTAAAFVMMALLIGEIGPARAVVITYINPIVAVGLGVAVLGERPGAGAIAGLLLILAGSWLSTDGRLPPSRLGGGRRRRPDAAGADSPRRPPPRRAPGAQPHPDECPLRLTT